MNSLSRLINIAQRALILVMPAIFSVALAACQPAPDSAADTANPVNVFSHNSYTFAPANIVVPTDDTRTRVTSIFVNENEVKKLVAEQLRIGGDQDAITAISSSNYTLSYDINAPSNSDANTFFAVEQNGNDPFRVDIFVTDPTGVGLSFASIIQRVPSFNVEVRINVLQATADRSIIRNSVRVAFRERDPSFSLDNTFTNDIARLSNNITFEPTAQVAENNRITATATLSRRGNILSEYALQRNPETSSITVFLALRSLANTAIDCGDGGIYLDNTDLRVKTARTYDYEVDPRPSYKCRLSISEDGINYQPLAIVASAAALDTIESRGNSIVSNLAPLPLNSNSVLAPPTSNSSIGCSATNACYYADLNLEITDLDELPKIDASFAAFTPSNEGVGPRDVYEAAAVKVSGNDLASGTVPDISKRLTIIDRDWNPITKAFLPVSEVVIAAVSPSHGRDAFTIEKVSALANQY
nr:hypothetical protein [Gammaproteobacteria bacterium]